jgi:predicted chitinase/Ca2+-binding EF-hand superfamily protein
MPADSWTISLPVVAPAPVAPVAPVVPAPVAVEPAIAPTVAIPVEPAVAPVVAVPAEPVPAPVASVPVEAPAAPIEAIGDVPPPAKPTRPPAPVYTPKRGRLASPERAFARLDKNDSDKLSRTELKREASAKKLDRNHDHVVTRGEYVGGKLRAQSFKGLDRNHDGKLAGREISNVVSPSGAAYDANGNGAVTKSEFLKAREADARATRPSAAHRKATAEHDRKRSAAAFKLADTDRSGVLKGAELKSFKAYDTNHNKGISKKEFSRGQAADRERAEKGLRLEGRLGDGVAKRLHRDRFDKKQHIAKPAPFIDPKAVARLLGAPLANVQKSLPQLVKALRAQGIKDKASMIAAIATVRTEVGSFMPINEYGDASYFAANYNNRSDLGNRYGTNDGVTYHGRGFVQLTGRANYGTYGRAIGVDLVKNPAKALQPKVAAKLLVQYFKGRGIPDQARQGDWVGVRESVNGGHNGLDTFLWAVNRLKSSHSWFKK